MVRTLQTMVVIVAASVILAGCVDAPLVVQGKVLACDSAAKTLLVEDERQPGQPLTFALEKADIGAEPAVGDLVRVAYHNENGKLVAIRLMNLSHQTELKKKG